MGNFWIPQFDSSSSSSFSSTRPSSPGIAQNTSNEGTHSGTGSAFSSRLDEISPNGQILPITPTLKIFSFAELKKATRNFGFGLVVGGVFKGWIDEKTFAPTEDRSGMAIAVKKFPPDDNFAYHDKYKDASSWYNANQNIPFSKEEVNNLGSLSHPNILRLLGHSEQDDGEALLLVYEFMPRGSLKDHLFRRGSAFQSLSWSIRLKIAIGAARGLAFIHCSEREIRHRSFQPSDVLLDSNYNAKISDVGVPRNSPLAEFPFPTRDPYSAPEYIAAGLQALGRNRPSEQHSFVKWAEPYLSDWSEVLSRVMDQRLEGQYPSEVAVQAARLILQSQPCPKKPSIHDRSGGSIGADSGHKA